MQNNDIPTAAKAGAAGAGAVVTALMMTPLDVVKTRMQSSTASPIVPVDLAGCPRTGMQFRDACFKRRNCHHFYPNAIRNSSSVTTAMAMVRREGVAALWSGLSPTLIMVAPATALYFAMYEELKFKLDEIAPTYSPLVAGASARSLAASVTSPLELMRTRMQSVRTSDGLLKSLQLEIRKRGSLSLWRGLGPTLFRDVPFSALYWLGVERIKEQLTLSVSENSAWTSFSTSFISGAISGMFAAAITTPFDVVKTRIQTTDGPTSAMFREMATVFETRGFRGLFAGLGPRVARVAPSCAIMIASYEVGKHVFKQYVSPDKFM